MTGSSRNKHIVVTVLNIRSLVFQSSQKQNPQFKTSYVSARSGMYNTVCHRGQHLKRHSFIYSRSFLLWALTAQAGKRLSFTHPGTL